MADNHDSHHVNYALVFVALCGFTGLSVLFDFMSFLPKGIIIVLVLSVAVAKASCVLMFFMHLKFEGNWKFVLLAPTTILSIGLPLALAPDVAVPYYTPIVPQRGEWGEQMKEFRETHAGGHGHGEAAGAHDGAGQHDGAEQHDGGEQHDGAEKHNEGSAAEADE